MRFGQQLLAAVGKRIHLLEPTAKDTRAICGRGKFCWLEALLHNTPSL